MRVHFKKTILQVLWGATVILAASSGAFAQVNLTGAANTYTQNFDSLSSTAATSPYAPFTNNSTIAGLYAYQTASGGSTPTFYRSSNGNTGFSSLHSFGTSGSGERAFGSIAGTTGSTTGDFLYGFYFTNTDPSAKILSFTLSYTGEQWRSAGVADDQSLTFDYQVFASGTTGETAITSTGYTPVSALTFTAPTPGPQGALNGNAAANRTVFGPQIITFATPVTNGQSVFVRFTDIDDPGVNDHGLAIDDFSFVANYDTPEPGTLPLLGMGFVTGLGMVGRSRRRK